MRPVLNTNQGGILDSSYFTTSLEKPLEVKGQPLDYEILELEQGMFEIRACVKLGADSLKDLEHLASKAEQLTKLHHDPNLRWFVGTPDDLYGYLTRNMHFVVKVFCWLRAQLPPDPTSPGIVNKYLLMAQASLEVISDCETVIS